MQINPLLKISFFSLSNTSNGLGSPVLCLKAEYLIQLSPKTKDPGT